MVKVVGTFSNEEVGEKVLKSNILHLEKESISYLGHRERVRKILEKNGIDSFFEHNMLEFLLFYAIPYKDTKPLAYDLLNRFGNIYGVFSAPLTALESVKGISHNTALYLHALGGAGKRYAKESGFVRFMSTTDKILDYMKGVVTPNTEGCFLVNVNNDDEIIGVEKVAEGADNALEIPLRLILKTALYSNMRRLIVVHNHPSGKATPSGEDKTYTYKISSMLSASKIQLIDHIIVYEKYAFSMKSSKLYCHNWSLQ